MNKNKKKISKIKIIFTFLFLTFGLLIAINIHFHNNMSTKYDFETEENNILDDIEDSNWIPVADENIIDTESDIIAFLSLPKFKDNYYIDMPIKNGISGSILATAIGHFDNTPLLDGNVCLVAHNSGTNKNGQYVGYFDRLKELQEGDEIIYSYLSKDYTYKVISNTIISQYDVSVLENTNNNLLTLITCIKGKENRQYRRCVVAER